MNKILLNILIFVGFQQFILGAENNIILGVIHILVVNTIYMIHIQKETQRIVKIVLKKSILCVPKDTQCVDNVFMSLLKKA